MSQMRDIVERILNKYYYGHHDQEQLKEELSATMATLKVCGHIGTKRRIVDAIEFRLSVLDDIRDSVAKEAVKNELLKVEKYVRGMVVKRDE